MKLTDIVKGTGIELEGRLYVAAEPVEVPAGAANDAVAVKLRDVMTGELCVRDFTPDQEVETVELESRWLSYHAWEKRFYDESGGILNSVEVVVPEGKLACGGEWVEDPLRRGSCLALYVDGELVCVGPEGYVERPDFTIADGVLVKYAGQDSVVHVPEGVTEIGTGAFLNNDRIERVALPECLEAIGSKAFYNCPNLTEVDMPKTLRRIEFDAFSGQNQGRTCGIESVSFPEGFEKIVTSAFYGCKKLSSVTFREGLRSIGDRAFGETAIANRAWRTGSQEFLLPSSVRELGSDALGFGKASEVAMLADAARTMATREQLSTTLVPFLPDDEEALAWVLAFQQSKTWSKAVGKKARKRSGVVLRRSVELLSGESKLAAKTANNLVDFALTNIGDAKDESVTALSALLVAKRQPRAAKKLGVAEGLTPVKAERPTKPAKKAARTAGGRPQPTTGISLVRIGDAFLSLDVEFADGTKASFSTETYASDLWLVVTDCGADFDWGDDSSGWPEEVREATLRGVDLPVEAWSFEKVSGAAGMLSFVNNHIVEVPECTFSNLLSGSKVALRRFAFEAGYTSGEGRPEAVCIECDFESGETRTRRGYVPFRWGGVRPFEESAKPEGEFRRFTFGRYPKDNEWQVAPLEWLSIDEDDGSMLLITKDVIDCRPIDSMQHKTTWEDCELRSWLNGGFLDSAFTDEERALLLPCIVKTKHNRKKTYFETTDYAFILSREETEQLFDPLPLGEAQPTKVAKQHDLFHHLASFRNNGRITKKGACWMMRLPASLKTTPDMFDPYADNCVGYGSTAENPHGIRPVIRVKKLGM